MVAISRRHDGPEEIEDFLSGYAVGEIVRRGSSLKFCEVARGAADLYPRFGPTHEWDIAAGHAVLRAAGGRLTTLDGRPMTYGKPDFLNPGYVARGGVPHAVSGPRGGPGGAGDSRRT